MIAVFVDVSNDGDDFMATCPQVFDSIDPSWGITVHPKGRTLFSDYQLPVSVGGVEEEDFVDVAISFTANGEIIMWIHGVPMQFPSSESSLTSILDVLEKATSQSPTCLRDSNVLNKYKMRTIRRRKNVDNIQQRKDQSMPQEEHRPGVAPTTKA